jgi:hypothetical protein
MKSPEERDAVLRAFRLGSLQAITAARTLDEGIDVPDVSVAVIVAGSTVRRQRIQRIGRILRPAQRKKARILVCYVAGARDDPAMREDPDAFYEEMKGLGRVISFRWPAEAGRISNWLLDVDLLATRRQGSEPGLSRSGAGGAAPLGAPALVPLEPVSSPAARMRNLSIEFELRESGPG